jgi:predicted metal-binding membrane protein
MANENPDGRRPLTVNKDYQLADRIAQKLRSAGLGCEIINLGPTAPVVLRRERIVVILALALLTALAWSYLLWLSTVWHGADVIPGDIPWGAMEFAFVFAMWTVMMVGMMTPAAVPMILMYARMGRQTAAHDTPFAATVWFSAGYFLVWIAFALLATFVQWAFERAELLDSAMAGTSNVVGGLLFVAAGSYQWTRLKDVCLTQCQTPFAFLMRQGGFRGDAPGSLMLGIRHGAYCVGCCWTLTALLLVGGVMNVFWIVLLALLIFLEKVTPFGRQIALLAGSILVVAGAWLFSMGM